jgi:large subunit ribosomal protein L23
MALFESKTTKKVTKEKKALTIRESAFAHRYLLRPRITEKAYALNANDQYVFEVSRDAHKHVIARSVEEAFGVHVVDVRTVNLPGKTKSFGKGQTKGRRSPVKKALVTIAPGETIELFKAGI